MRFTIRDVLWLTVVVAILTSWLIDHRQLDHSQRRKELELEHQIKLAKDSWLQAKAAEGALRVHMANFETLVTAWKAVHPEEDDKEAVLKEWEKEWIKTHPEYKKAPLEPPSGTSGLSGREER